MYNKYGAAFGILCISHLYYAITNCTLSQLHGAKPCYLNSSYHWYILASSTEHRGKEPSACFSCREKLANDFLWGEQIPHLAVTIRSTKIYGDCPCCSYCRAAD